MPRALLRALVHLHARSGHAAVHRDPGEEKLSPQKDDVVIGTNRYRAEVGTGYVLETGADGKKKQYRIEYALGGKNVFYFLTPLDKGRLQTLPVAYDVRKKEWFDTALSGLRHFPGQQGTKSRWGGRNIPTPSTPPATAATSASSPPTTT